MNPTDFNKLKQHILTLIFRELENKRPPYRDRDEFVRNTLKAVYQSLNIKLPQTIQDQLFKEILDEILGFGPLQSLLEDHTISEVMVNGPNSVYIEQKGKLVKTGITFEDDDAVLRIIEKIIMPLGRRIDADTPTVDARLPDGSRVNAVIPPVAIDGPTITIRNLRKVDCL
jgi:pilus assembly protein CpaF